MASGNPYGGCCNARSRVVTKKEVVEKKMDQQGEMVIEQGSRQERGIKKSQRTDKSGRGKGRMEVEGSARVYVSC